jgi:hypothetical protein
MEPAVYGAPMPKLAGRDGLIRQSNGAPFQGRDGSRLFLLGRVHTTPG